MLPRPHHIPNKREFFRLWKLGVLGNRTFLWRSIEDVPATIARVGFRELGKAGGGKWTLVNRIDADAEYGRWKAEGRNFMMDGSVPNDRSIMQGEVCRTHRGMESYLTTGYGLPPMRVTMGAGRHQHRGYLETKVLLDHHMDPSSRDDLDMLLEQFPEATVELTCFDVDTGVFPGRNTIFWEIRNF